MIVLNGVKFAETDDEFVNSLFDKDGTCGGYYKKLKNEFKLYDHNKKQIGALTKHNVLVKRCADIDGKPWYNLGDIELLGNYPFIKQRREVMELADTLVANLLLKGR